MYIYIRLIKDKKAPNGKVRESPQKTTDRKDQIFFCESV